jgi:hypothetical protein
MSGNLVQMMAYGQQAYMLPMTLEDVINHKMCDKECDKECEQYENDRNQFIIANKLDFLQDNATTRAYIDKLYQAHQKKNQK